MKQTFFTRRALTPRLDALFLFFTTKVREEAQVRVLRGIVDAKTILDEEWIDADGNGRLFLIAVASAKGVSVRELWNSWHRWWNTEEAVIALGASTEELGSLIEVYEDSFETDRRYFVEVIREYLSAIQPSYRTLGVIVRRIVSGKKVS